MSAQFIQFKLNKNKYFHALFIESNDDKICFWIDRFECSLDRSCKKFSYCSYFNKCENKYRCECKDIKEYIDNCKKSEREKIELTQEKFILENC
jgi:hypothetical protein